MSQTDAEARWITTGKNIERYHTNKDCRTLEYADNITRLTDGRDETRDVRECRVCAGECDGGGEIDKSLTCPHCGAAVDTPEHIKLCDGTPQAWREGPIYHTYGNCPAMSDNATPTIRQRVNSDLEPCGVCHRAKSQTRAEWPDGGDDSA